MKFGDRDMPGPGDECTWPPCTNHPNDPRAEEDTCSDAEYQELAEEYIIDDDEQRIVMMETMPKELSYAAARLYHGVITAEEFSDIYLECAVEFYKEND